MVDIRVLHPQLPHRLRHEHGADGRDEGSLRSHQDHGVPLAQDSVSEDDIDCRSMPWGHLHLCACVFVCVCVCVHLICTIPYNRVVSRPHTHVK